MARTSMTIQHCDWRHLGPAGRRGFPARNPVAPGPCLCIARCNADLIEDGNEETTRHCTWSTSQDAARDWNQARCAPLDPRTLRATGVKHAARHWTHARCAPLESSTLRATGARCAPTRCAPRREPTCAPRPVNQAPRDESVHNTPAQRRSSCHQGGSRRRAATKAQHRPRGGVQILSGFLVETAVGFSSSGAANFVALDGGTTADASARDKATACPTSRHAPADDHDVSPQDAARPGMTTMVFL
jgi:hypothetical protein